MINKKIVLILLVLLLCISSVNAIGYTGGLGADNISSMIYSVNGFNGGNINITGMYARQFENIGKPHSGVQFFDYANTITTDTGSPKSASTSFTVYMSNGTVNSIGEHILFGRQVGTGIIGYQRVFNTANPPVEQKYGYVYFIITSWNQGTETGGQHLALVYDHAAVYNLKINTYDSIPGTQSNLAIALSGAGSAGTASPIGNGGTSAANLTVYNSDASTHADYDVTDTNEQSIGIDGFVYKVEGLSQALVYNGITGGIITSESTVSNVRFNFSLVKQPIVIGIRTASGVKYNTSVLYSNYAPVTPIPTTPNPNQTYVPTVVPTGVPTYPNGTPISGYIKLTVKNYTDQSALSGVAIGVWNPNDMGVGFFNVTTGTDGSYTFRNYGTGGNLPMQNDNVYYFQLSKTGYLMRTTDQRFYANYPTVSTIMLEPTGWQPTATSFVLELNYRNSETDQLIRDNLQGTVTISNQSSSWTLTRSNPNGGLTLIAGLTAPNSYKIDVNLQGYKSYTGYYTAPANIVGTNQIYYVYLEPTSSLPDTFSLSVSPASGTLNDTYTLALTGDISTATNIEYRYRSSDNFVSAFDNIAGGETIFSKVGASWLGWSGSSFSIATANPASISAKIKSNVFPQTTDLTVTAYVTIGGNRYTATDTIDIVDSGKIPKIIVARDMSNDALMSEFTSHILDIYTNTWTNTTYTQANFANAYYWTTPNALLMWFGSADGYYDTIPIYDSFTGNNDGHGIDLHFYPQRTPPTIENTSLSVHVRGTGGNGIGGSRVTLNDGQTAITNNAGNTGFWVLNGVRYTATASAYGYSSGTGSITTSNTSENVINIILVGSTPTPTQTGGTQPVTPRVTPTYSNWTSVNASLYEEWQCVEDTSDIGVWNLLRNFVACSGVSGAQNQGLAIAAVIMLIMGMALSRFGKGMGAMAGVIAGAAVSFGMGALPFWLLLFVVIVCGLVFAGMITKQQGG